MSERIQYQASDGEPAFFRWSNRRIVEGPSGFGPADPIEDLRLRTCPRHGVEHAVSETCPLCLEALWERNPLNPQRSGE